MLMCISGSRVHPTSKMKIFQLFEFNANHVSYKIIKVMPSWDLGCWLKQATFQGKKHSLN